MGRAKHDGCIGTLEGVRLSGFWNPLHVNLFDKFINRKGPGPGTSIRALHGML